MASRSWRRPLSRCKLKPIDTMTNLPAGYYDEYDVWGGVNDDPYYSTGFCDLPGCIIQGEHFASECHTARDAAQYYHDEEGTSPPLWTREPFYTLSLLWSAVRWRDEVRLQELHYHVHVDLKKACRQSLPSRLIRKLMPTRCIDCGKRWGNHDTCLPF